MEYIMELIEPLNIPRNLYKLAGQETFGKSFFTTNAADLEYLIKDFHPYYLKRLAEVTEKHDKQLVNALWAQLRFVLCSKLHPRLNLYVDNRTPKVKEKPIFQFICQYCKCEVKTEEPRRKKYCSLSCGQLAASMRYYYKQKKLKEIQSI